MPSTRDRLAEYAQLLTGHGPDSAEAAAYVDANAGDAEFVELAALARTLMSALASPAPLPPGLMEITLTRPQASAIRQLLDDVTAPTYAGRDLPTITAEEWQARRDPGRPGTIGEE